MPLFTFTFDDGKLSQIRDIYPALKKHGFRATFYIIGDKIGFPGRLGYDDLLLLESEGNEIGSHSLSHRPLTKLSIRDVEKEASESLRVLRRFRVKSFAYPFGRYDKRVLEAVSRYYDSAKSYDANAMVSNTRSDLRRYELKSFSVEDILRPLIDVGSNECILSQPILRSDGWFIFTFHGKSSLNLSSVRAAFKPSNLNYDQVRSYFNYARTTFSLSSIRSKPESSVASKLDSFCASVKRLGIPVATISEALDYYPGHSTLR